METARCRNTDPETSAAAAASLSPEVLNALDSKIMRALKDSPEGLTSLETSEVTGISRVSVSPRFAPLRRRGFVVDSGLRRKGEESRRAGIVWKACDV